MMRTANPALNESTFETAGVRTDQAMTIQGTVNKTGFALVLLLVAASWVWDQTMSGAGIPPVVWLLGTFGGFVVGLVTIFKKEWAPITTPVYAILEGLLLGAISSAFEKQFPGIVVPAVALTFGTLGGLLLAYKSRLIQPTENFKLGVAAATLGICLVYVVNLIMGFFGKSIPLIHQGGPLGILFSLAIVVIAALNLVLDFDFIEQGATQGAPKYMEWYAAFGLLVTLIWLYMEILRLLAKLRERR